ncbi:MAG: hypothetical protein GC136_10095 [Alphaproteobacteria bacterium]|nr:hypothetical protein [Alphaproteobacteria bacterium]
MASPRNLRALQVGTALADGSIYAGFSPTTAKPLFTAATDRIVKAGDVGLAAMTSVEHGLLDWRAPSYEELKQLFDVHEAGALKDTFNNTGGAYTSYYATSDITTNGMSDADFMRVRMIGKGDAHFPAERLLPLIYPVTLRLVRG